ncbi:mRNA 3'-end-processing protein rna14 [Coemansia sp. RSA 552]|nr:mRNA 3'-end-processing protein rna14 [Coemansia sp. RSA 552]
MYQRRLRRSAYDADAWVGLLRAANASGDPEQVNAAYTAALNQYPSSGKLLAATVDFELRRGDKESAESIFNNNLFNVPSIELWMSYLNYVLKSNAAMDHASAAEMPTESRATVMDCYKLVLSNIGTDREAGGIWVDYISFINSAQTHAPYEEQQKTDLLRETYQAAVAIPMLRVEEIWKGYDAFEVRVDRMGAKQQLSKHSAAYMTARTALREMNRLCDSINATGAAHGLPMPPEWTSREVDHLDAWKRYLRWELSNPLHLSDVSMQHRRVVYAYSLACMDLRYYPEIWIEFSEYLSSAGQQNEALAKLHSASEVLKESLAVQFAYAELAEKMKQLETCKQIYEHVVSTQRARVDTTTARYSRKLTKLEKRLDQLSGKKAAPDASNGVAQKATDAATAAPAAQQPDNPESDSDGAEDIMEDSDTSMGSDSEGDDGLAMDDEAVRRRTARRATKARQAISRRMKSVQEQKERELEKKREAYTLSWIMYLRYVQRSEGIDAMRQLLRRPRSEPLSTLTHHLWIAAALMEYHVAKRSDVAGKLFERYSKDYSDSPQYIKEYMSYLIDSGDDTNVRALFERSHGTAAGDKGAIWAMYADFEYNYGDMSAISKLDKRFIDKFDHESVLTRMATRYSYLDVNCVAVNEFGVPYRRDMQRFDAARNRTDGNATGMPLAENAGAEGELPDIMVASITGRGLNKTQLLAPIPGQFAQPSVDGLREYEPEVEPTRFSDADGGRSNSYPTRHAPPRGDAPSHGQYRQMPYSRSPGYSSDTRAPSRGAPGMRYGSRDRGAYHGRP